MEQIDDIFFSEIIKQLEKNFYLMGFSTYRSFHMTMHNYLLMGSYSFIDKMLLKIGKPISKHMDINFGLTKKETEEIILKLLMIKI